MVDENGECEDYQLSQKERLALIQINLMKNELIYMCHYDTPNGGVQYELAKDKKNGTRGFAYFALRKPAGKLPAGIYQRFTLAHGSAIRPVMFFVSIPTYLRRLDFYGIAQKKALETFNRSLPLYLKQLLKEQGL